MLRLPTLHIRVPKHEYALFVVRLHTPDFASSAPAPQSGLTLHPRQPNMLRRLFQKEPFPCKSAASKSCQNVVGKCSLLVRMFWVGQSRLFVFIQVSQNSKIRKNALRPKKGTVCTKRSRWPKQHKTCTLRMHMRIQVNIHLCTYECMCIQTPFHRCPTHTEHDIKPIHQQGARATYTRCLTGRILSTETPEATAVRGHPR